jgi:CheY-like chemotaxis protein
MGKINSMLLIDDDKITNFINTYLLKNLQISDELIVLSNGSEGLEFLKELSLTKKMCPEVILLDINMPITDGFEFVKGFKELSLINKNNIQIIVLTTSSSPRDIERMKLLGVKDFINKPLTSDKLKKAIAKHDSDFEDQSNLKTTKTSMKC